MMKAPGLAQAPRRAALAAVLAAGVSFPTVCVEAAEPRYVLPAAEIGVQHILFNLNSRLHGEDFARISGASMRRNLRGPWEFDGDGFLTNQFLHPHQGAMYFMAARSSHLGFWSAAFYTFLGSLTWEYLMEVVIIPPAGVKKVSAT